LPNRLSGQRSDLEHILDIIKLAIVYDFFYHMSAIIGCVVVSSYVYLYFIYSGDLTNDADGHI